MSALTLAWERMAGAVGWCAQTAHGALFALRLDGDEGRATTLVALNPYAVIRQLRAMGVNARPTSDKATMAIWTDDEMDDFRVALVDGEWRAEKGGRLLIGRAAVARLIVEGLQ